MNLITAFFSWIFDPQPAVPERDERYLAAAVDMCDLERRIRTLDEHRFGAAFGPFGQNA